jgi:integrase
MARGSILPRRLKNGEARYDVTIELPPVNGKRRQEYKTFKTKREAAAYLNARLGEIEKGVVVEKSKMTVADLMADYLNDAWATARPTTLASYEHTIRKHILPALGPVPVQKLTPLELKKFYANLDAQLCAAARGRRVLQLCHFHIRKALKEALRMGLVVRNVADSVTLPRGEDRKEQQTWTEEQARQFLAVAPQSTYGPLWAVMLATGMRRGEVLGLRWQDVDWENGVLYPAKHGSPPRQAHPSSAQDQEQPSPGACAAPRTRGSARAQAPPERAAPSACRSVAVARPRVLHQHWHAN